MAQAHQADRAMPQVAIYLLAILVGVVVIVAVLASGTLNFAGADSTFGDRWEVSPATLQAGRDWEMQRKQQSGYVDPVIQSGREWERQRKQQSGGSE